jgi:NADP-dependent 3-hydroxy acid dehydrogenase YdfG
VLDVTVCEISSQSGNRVVPMALDVRDADAVKRCCDEMEKAVGFPDIVVNNARVSLRLRW